MDKKELISSLQALVEEENIRASRLPGWEKARLQDDLHCDADALLLKYINDPEVTKVYLSLTRWYD